MKKEVGYDWKTEHPWEIDIGGYKMHATNKELKIYGNTEVDLLKIPNGAVALKAFDTSMFEKFQETKNTEIYENFKFEDGIVYILVSAGEYGWIFKDIDEAYRLANTIFLANYRGAQIKAKKNIDRKVKEEN